MSDINELLQSDALEVAPALLGALFSTRVAGRTVTARITEVEAYHGLGTPGPHDGGSHARSGPTPRNRIMWGDPGRLYVYLSYGIHSAVNIVCSPSGRASAVLVRAGEIVAGADVAAERRASARTARDLARGPGRFAQAVGLTHREHDGIDGLGGPGSPWLLDPAADAAQLLLPTSPPPQGTVRSGPRVGVSGEAGTALFPWRFWLDGEPSVSPYRASPRIGS